MGTPNDISPEWRAAADSGQGRAASSIGTPQWSEAGWSSEHVIGAGGSGSSEARLKPLVRADSLAYYVDMSACIQKHFHS